jgi:hypothetical protein
VSNEEVLKRAGIKSIETIISAATLNVDTGLSFQNARLKTAEVL